MPDEYFYGQMRNSGSRKRAAKVTRPSELRGVPDTGRIVKLFVGQGHGIIRLSDGREIFFHRADIQEGTSINDFAIGDQVSFERLDDRISGSRALGVAKRRRTAR
jgi:cold shock CspA family protein